MLKRFIRKAAAAARPVNARGVADTNVDESAPLSVKAARNSFENVWTGLWPVDTSTTAIATTANTTDPIGTTTVSHLGWWSRRSMRMLTRSPRAPRREGGGRSCRHTSRHQQPDRFDGCDVDIQLTADPPLVHDC